MFAVGPAIWRLHTCGQPSRSDCEALHGPHAQQRHVKLEAQDLRDALAGQRLPVECNRPAAVTPHPLDRAIRTRHAQ
eukprot:4279777-Lingulodinium_polyedra.AAC.1